MFTNQPSTASNGLATASLVVGIASIPALLLCGLGALGGLVAIVLGILGISRSGRTPGSPGKGQAIGGIAVGTVAVLAGLAILAVLALGWSTEVDTDRPDGFCDTSRFMQDPDC
jgi:O-antigen ligase